MYGYGGRLEEFTPPVHNSYNEHILYTPPSIASFPISPLACECECGSAENTALLYVLIFMTSLKFMCVAVLLSKLYVKDTPVAESTVSEFPAFERQTINPVYTSGNEPTLRTHTGMEQLRNRQHSAPSCGTEWDYPAR